MLHDLIVPILLGYLVVGVVLTGIFRGIPGIMLTVILGWLFLPPGQGINLPGLPMYTKEYAVSYALLLGIILTDSTRVLRYRPSLLDIPILIWIGAPFFSSVTNGLGAYDGLSNVYGQIFIYGVPYFVGRLYIRTPNDIREIAKWFIIAGLIATPFVLWESRMSPQLNADLYGYRVSGFQAAKRLGGYRPMLFMRHGLEVGLWMSTCAAVAIWALLTSPREIRIMKRPVTVPSAIVVLATILCRSLGALVLLFGTSAAGVFTRTTGLRISLIALVLTPSLYLSVRLSNIWSPSDLTAIVRSFDDQRADSLEARLGQEQIISEHALRRPLFGWGGFDRYRPLNDNGEAEPVDGWTSITLGKNGLLGLISLQCFTTLPALLLLLRLRGKDLTDQIWAPAIGVLLACSLFAYDILFNAFPTPLHFVGIGALTTTAILSPRWQRIIRDHAIKQTKTRSMGTDPNVDHQTTLTPRAMRHS